MQTKTHQQLYAPLQLLSSKFRNSKRDAQRGLTQVLKSIIDLKQKASKDDIIKTLSQDKQKLYEIKRKLSQNALQQTKLYSVAKKRVHKNEQNFEKTIINFLNCRQNSSTQKIQQQLNLEDYTNIQTKLYIQAFKISSDISKNNLRSIKQWCYENSHMLNKIKSSLEFKLVSAEYLNILNNASKVRAIQFLRKSLQTLTLSNQQKKNIQKLTILLIKDQKIQLDKYLKEMKEIFFDAYSQIYHIKFSPDMPKFLGIGISSLKTVCCSKAELTNQKVCPVCEPKMNKIATKIPMLNKQQSSLICRINGSLMTEQNPPIVLPNGQLYSLNGLQQTQKNGTYFCKTTNTQYDKTLGRKVFLT